MREAIILAGGLGTRLKAYIPNVPKPMANINEEPFLDLLIRNLSNNGFKRIILCVGYQSEKIISYFGNEKYSTEIIYSLENEQKLLGTGGAIKKALNLSISEKSFVFNGDTFLDLNIDLVEKHFNSRKNNIIIARYVSDLSRYGKLIINNGKLKGFKEKGQFGSGFINAGCYVLKRESLKYFPNEESFSLEVDFLSKKINELNMDTFVANGLFIDIGIPSDYNRAQKLLKSFQK